MWLNVCATREKLGWKALEGKCNAHCRATGQDCSCMTVESVDTQHTCDVSAATGGKRNCPTRHISEPHQFWISALPLTEKKATLVNFVKMTKCATGALLKKGQASSAVRSKVNAGSEAQIGQCMWLPSMVKACHEMDPQGTFLSEDQPCWWDTNNELRQFVRCHVCSLTAKHFGPSRASS